MAKELLGCHLNFAAFGGSTNLETTDATQLLTHFRLTFVFYLFFSFASNFVENASSSIKLLQQIKNKFKTLLKNNIALYGNIKSPTTSYFFEDDPHFYDSNMDFKLLVRIIGG